MWQFQWYCNGHCMYYIHNADILHMVIARRWLGDFFMMAVVWGVEKTMFTWRNALYFCYAVRVRAVGRYFISTGAGPTPGRHRVCGVGCTGAGDASLPPAAQLSRRGSAPHASPLL